MGSGHPVGEAQVLTGPSHPVWLPPQEGHHIHLQQGIPLPGPGLSNQDRSGDLLGARHASQPSHSLLTPYCGKAWPVEVMPQLALGWGSCRDQAQDCPAQGLVRARIRNQPGTGTQSGNFRSLEAAGVRVIATCDEDKWQAQWSLVGYGVSLSVFFNIPFIWLHWVSVVAGRISG